MKINNLQINKPRQWPWVIAICVSAVAVAVALSMARQAPEKKTEPRLPPLVELQTPTFQAIQYQLSSQGTVQAKTETSLVSEVSGKIVTIADVFVAGGFFNKGDLLIQVEQADYKTAVKTAEAALANAKAMLEEEKARAKVAERDWLNYTAGKAPALGLRKPQLASALAKVQSAEADVERAMRDLNRTEIRAPYAGMVKSRAANLGQFVSRGNQLGIIVETTVAEVRLPLALSDLADLGINVNASRQALDLPVELSADELRWQATLVRTEGVLDEKSRVIYAVAEIQDPYQRSASASAERAPLRFGQFVNATISGRQSAPVLQLPRHLLKPENIVVVADQALKLQLRNVTIDRADQQYAYVLNGLQQGDQLVVSPLANPLAGLQVRTADSNEAPAAAAVNTDDADEKAISGNNAGNAP
jgi:RND family efflux transporter MFP subunit